MIKFEGDIIERLFKVYQDDPERRGTTLYDWLLLQSNTLGIKRIYRFEYVLVFESPEDEIVFRLKFGI